MEDCCVAQEVGCWRFCSGVWVWSLPSLGFVMEVELGQVFLWILCFSPISVIPPIPLDIHIYKCSLPTKYLSLPRQNCFLPTFLVLCYIFLTSCFHLVVSLCLVCFLFIFLSCCFLGLLSAYLRAYTFHLILMCVKFL
jgi:hypothetical protein